MRILECKRTPFLRNRKKCMRVCFVNWVASCFLSIFQFFVKLQSVCLFTCLQLPPVTFILFSPQPQTRKKRTDCFLVYTNFRICYLSSLWRGCRFFRKWVIIITPQHMPLFSGSGSLLQFHSFNNFSLSLIFSFISASCQFPGKKIYFFGLINF